VSGRHYDATPARRGLGLSHTMQNLTVIFDVSAGVVELINVTPRKDSVCGCLWSSVSNSFYTASGKSQYDREKHKWLHKSEAGGCFWSNPLAANDP
jgi:hypothetical protein